MNVDSRPRYASPDAPSDAACTPEGHEYLPNGLCCAEIAANLGESMSYRYPAAQQSAHGGCVQPLQSYWHPLPTAHSEVRACSKLAFLLRATFTVQARLQPYMAKPTDRGKLAGRRTFLGCATASQEPVGSTTFYPTLGGTNTLILFLANITDWDHFSRE